MRLRQGTGISGRVEGEDGCLLLYKVERRHDDGMSALRVLRLFECARPTRKNQSRRRLLEGP